MKRVIDRAVKACEIILMAAFFFGCSMQLDLSEGNGTASVNTRCGRPWDVRTVFVYDQFDVAVVANRATRDRFFRRLS